MEYIGSIALVFGVIISGISAFSPDEQTALEKLRPIVSDVLYRDYMQEDVYLIQWLRVKNLDPVKANQAIRKTHLWRKEKNIDKILTEDWTRFDKEFPYSLAGHDKEGRPLTYVNFGAAWDLRKAVLKGQRDKFTRHLDRMMEESATKARLTFNVTFPTATGVRDVPDWIVIHDLKSYSLKQNGCLGCIPAMLTYASNGDQHYSYSLKTAFSVNTPRIFESVGQVIRTVIAEETSKKFKIYGIDKQEYLEELSSIIAPDQLKLYFKY